MSTIHWDSSFGKNGPLICFAVFSQHVCAQSRSKSVGYLRVCARVCVPCCWSFEHLAYFGACSCLSASVSPVTSVPSSSSSSPCLLPSPGGTAQHHHLPWLNIHSGFSGQSIANAQSVQNTLTITVCSGPEIHELQSCCLDNLQAVQLFKVLFIWRSSSEYSDLSFQSAESCWSPNPALICPRPPRWHQSSNIGPTGESLEKKKNESLVSVWAARGKHDQNWTIFLAT